MLRRLMTLGRSPYLSEFEWNEGQNVDLGNICDSKVGKGRVWEVDPHDVLCVVYG